MSTNRTKQPQGKRKGKKPGKAPRRLFIAGFTRSLRKWDKPENGPAISCGDTHGTMMSVYLDDY